MAKNKSQNESCDETKVGDPCAPEACGDPSPHAALASASGGAFPIDDLKVIYRAATQHDVAVLDLLQAQVNVEQYAIDQARGGAAPVVFTARVPEAATVESCCQDLKRAIECHEPRAGVAAAADAGAGIDWKALVLKIIMTLPQIIQLLS